MNPCSGCSKKGQCPKRCKPKADFTRHMKRLNRSVRKSGKEDGKRSQT